MGIWIMQEVKNDTCGRIASEWLCGKKDEIYRKNISIFKYIT